MTTRTQWEKYSLEITLLYRSDSHVFHQILRIYSNVVIEHHQNPLKLRFGQISPILRVNRGQSRSSYLKSTSS